MRRVLQFATVVAVAVVVLWLIQEGLAGGDDSGGAASTTLPTSTSEPAAVAPVTVAVTLEDGTDVAVVVVPGPPSDGAMSSPSETTIAKRPTAALADGVEEQLPDEYDGLSLDIADILVALAILLGAAWFLWPRAKGIAPVSVTVTDGSGDGSADGRQPDEPKPQPDALAAIVRDRLAKVRLPPPSSVPGVEGETDGLISVIEAIDTTKTVGPITRALRAANPRSSRGYEARIALRRSDKTSEAGATVELYDLDRRLAISVSSVWEPTFEDAARTAAYQIAAALLTRLGRRERRHTWWRWEQTGSSLRAFQNAGWEIAHRRYDQAIDFLNAGLETDPGNLAIRLRLGHTYERQQRYRDALWVYQRVPNSVYPVDRSVKNSAEAGIIRWRTAVVLSNAEQWAEEWARDVAAMDGRTAKGDDPSRLLRAFFQKRYSSALGDEFTTLHHTLIADRSERETAIVPQTGNPFLRLRLPWYRQSARLMNDDDEHLTVSYLAWASGSGLDFRQPRDRTYVELHDTVARRLACGPEPKVPSDELERAAPAVSIVQYALRAAHVEIREIGLLQRRRAGLSHADLLSFHLATNRRAMDRLPAGDGAGALERQRQCLEEWRLLIDLGARLRLPRSTRARAQASYNIACTRALAVPSRNDDDSDHAWWERVDDEVKQVVDLLAEACQGVDSLIDAGHADWIVYEDPDLAKVRPHPRFKRFARAVLHRDVDALRSRTPDLEAIHVAQLERFAVDAAIASWRAAMISPPSRERLALLTSADAALHGSLATMLTSETPAVRSAVGPKVRALAPDSPDVPGWPKPTTERQALDPSVAGRVALAHRRAKVTATEVGKVVRGRLDREVTGFWELHVHLRRLQQRDVRTHCRDRLAAWLEVDEILD